MIRFNLLQLILIVQMVNIVSINVNGLRDQSKFQHFCNYCSENFYDVVCIQETFWSDDLVEKYQKFWGGRIFFM